MIALSFLIYKPYRIVLFCLVHVLFVSEVVTTLLKVVLLWGSLGNIIIVTCVKAYTAVQKYTAYIAVQRALM